MGQRSTVDIWLRKLSGVKRAEVEQLLRTSPTHKQAHTEAQRYGYRGSYDSIQTWRCREERRADQTRREEVRQETASVPVDTDPIGKLMILSDRVTNLCTKLVAVLAEHDWIEAGETRLTTPQATKLLAALPPLLRASAGTVIEMNQIRSQLDEKALIAATIAELGVDWQKTCHEDAGLAGLFEEVSRVTQSRLEIDRHSFLESYLRNHKKAADTAENVSS